MELRSLLGPRALPGLLLLPLAAALAPLPWTWEPVVAFAVLAGLARLGLRTTFVRKHDLLASRAATAPPRRRRPTWRILYGLTLPLVLVRVRTRVVRDLVLLFRGCDAQGALLLLLSPLSCLVLLDELATLPSRAALPWRVLTSTALGAAAVAYAVGPGIHRVRIRALAWERTCPNAGPWAMRSALAYGLGFATLHCAVVLATLARADSGRFAAELPGLVLPVLVLGTAMAHYVVVFTLASARGRRILGEGTLVLSLPFVALGVALLGILWPLASPLYFVVMLPWLARSAQHWDAAEVSW